MYLMIIGPEVDIMKRIYANRYAFALGAILSMFLYHSMNAVTGRFQLLFLPEPQLKTMAIKEFNLFIKGNKILDSKIDDKAAMAERVGKRLTNAIKDLYSTNEDVLNQLKNYEWEYCVIESPEVNAWCLPGGKIIVYSGLFSVAQTESALAIVMGHEIAHALARHGNERMSYSILLSGMGIVGEAMLSNQVLCCYTFKQTFSLIGKYYALLPALRDQEVEADKFGLIFAAYAGYDPREAISLWRTMHKKSFGDKLDFTSTHPSESRRIKELKGFMPIALEFYMKN